MIEDIEVDIQCFVFRKKNTVMTIIFISPANAPFVGFVQG